MSQSSSLLPDTETQRLWNPRLPSHYSGVYRHTQTADGVQMWAGRVKRNGRVRTVCYSRYPVVCARAVAAWYRDRYGARWHEFYQHRKSRRRPWRVHYSERFGGWLLTVWVNGYAETVVECPRPNRPTDHPKIFTSAQSARDFVGDYLAYRYGLDHGRELRRLPDPLSTRQVPGDRRKMAA